MSIHIKEYLSLLAVIGIIKTFSGNKKVNDAIKIICFFAMMSMVIFPLAASVANGDLLKNLSLSYGTVSEGSDKYSRYFAQNMADGAISLKLQETEEGFKREFILRGIQVLECRAEFDGGLNVSLKTDKQIDTGVIDRLKNKYGVDKVSIRLVNTYD